jgi:Ca2+-binding RTX toxin-like protein
LEELIEELDLDLSPELLADAAAGATALAFEYAVLTILTGGAGTAARLAIDAADSAALAALTFEVLDIAFPELGLGAKFKSISDLFTPDLEDMKAKIAALLNKAAFELSGAEAMTVVDGENRTTADKLTVTGDGKIDYMLAHGFATIEGRGGNDWLIHTGTGQASGGEGDDLIFAWRPDFVTKGQALNGRADGPKAVSDLHLTLDGGAGNDWVIAIGGEKAVTIGGTGRDWIFNSSKGGIVYGDTVDGRSPDGSDLEAKQNADNFWWWSDVTLMDARQNDVLTFFGIPLTGGSQTIPAWVMGSAGFNPLVIGANNLSASAVNAPMYFDNFLPFMIYTMKGNDLHVVNLFSAMAGGIFTAMYPGSPAVSSGAMVVKDFEFKSSPWGFQLAEWTLNQNTGDLNMVFKDANPWLGALALYGVFGGAAGWLLGMMLPMLDELANTLAATLRLLKGVGWSAERDPLVLDLDGDGLESVALGDQAVYFDTNGDVFGERTAWLSGDDGFLTLDRNGNGRIDDLSEMFGPQTGRGFQDLRLLDSNSDGAITAADRDFARISVWQDRDQDGATDAGELMSLSHHRITRIDIAGARELDITTPQGVELLAESSFTRADGSRGAILEAIFATNPVDTQFKGEKGIAAWLANAGLNAKGYGRLTDLSVAMSNDFGISQTVRQTAAAMTVPKLDTLVGQVGAVLEKWAQTLELTRELTPVLTRIVNGQTEVVDRGVYVETATGGHWTLASGAVVRGPGGAVIARPMLEQVMAQAAASGTQWKLEQLFSPVSRSAPLQHRDEAPYLAEIVDGRAIVKDYGIKAADGSWRLASGTTVTGGDGWAIARPTKNDILAMAPRPGHEWRLEEIGHNPYAAMSVERIGVNMVDGIAIDYSVEVTDRDGTFHVWARNLDRALELQHRDGTASAFGLRNHAIDFDELDEVGSSLDSTYRVEMLTPGQFHFMVSLVGVDFRPQMLAARIDGTTGVITYSVNESGRPSLEAEDYVSGIRPMIELLGQAVTSYIGVSRDFAVNLAMQGGLKSFFPGITYDMAGGFYSSTSGRELAPVFEAIFRAAPKGFDQAYAWLEDWNEILFRIYGDYRLNPAVNLQGATVRVDKAFIFQMMLPAFQNISIDVDLAAAMNAFTVDESRLRTHTAAARDVQGTAGVDFLLMTSGNQTLRGGDGADFYFAGRAFGNDVIHDRDSGGDDELRFTEVRSSDIEARREGQDLVLLVRNSTNQIRLKDQFLGELNERVPFRTERLESGVNLIVFADGVIWDRFRMAMEVARPRDGRDTYVGSGSADVLWGGRGNDNLQGLLGGDIYIFGRGDGQNVIDDRGGTSFGPINAGIDFLNFAGNIAPKHLKLTRDGNSADLRIVLLDDQGRETQDTIIIRGQFGGYTLNMGGFDELFKKQFGVGLSGYLNNAAIERFIFGDGSSMDEAQIVEQVLRNARTDGDDAIYGMPNVNTLDGGRGRDYLSGGQGSDTYIFGRGYGHDQIEDNDSSFKALGGSPDTLRFADGLIWSDFDFVREADPDTLTLRVKGTNDAVTLQDFLEFLPFIEFLNRIETLVFGDRTQWSWLELLQHFIDIARTTGNDRIHGFLTQDLIDGGAGNDRLEGKDGDDIYVFARGYGNDTIFDSPTPEGSYFPTTNDRILFQDLAVNDVEFSRTALDLIITIRTTGERLVLENQYVREGGQKHAIEYFEFTDRTLVYTNYNPEDVERRGTAAGEILDGSSFGEVMDGREGNDTLRGGDGGDTYRFDVGYGQDVIQEQQLRASWNDRPRMDIATQDSVHFGPGITRQNVVFIKDGVDLVISILSRPDTLRIRHQFSDTTKEIENFYFASDNTWLTISAVEQMLRISGGTRGDDTITGTANGSSTLDGRQGDDTLIGGTAADNYVFGAEYGSDAIQERPDSPRVIDRVVFGSTVAWEALVLRRDGNDLLIDLGNGNDVLTIKGGLASTRIEAFNFAGRAPIGIEEVINKLLQGTKADDRIVGFDNRNDDLAGRGGSDALEGGTGDDTYRFGIGSGSDSILDTRGADRIVFDPGLTRDMLTVVEWEGNLILTLRQTGEKLVVLNGSAALTTNHVESLVFVPSGTTQPAVTVGLQEVLSSLRGGAPNGSQESYDVRTFTAVGLVRPGAGSDTIFMGQDTRVAIESGGGMDRIELPSSLRDAQIILEGFSPSDAIVRPAGSSLRDILISFPPTGDQILLVDAFSRAALPPIVFSNGVIWDREALIARSIEGQTGPESDIVIGSALNDSIEAGRGDDEIRSGQGDDTIRFSRGDGRDVVIDEGGIDSLQIFGYRPSDMRVTRTDPDRSEILLSFIGGADQILLRNGSGFGGIDVVVFSDGTSFNRNALLQQTLLGTTHHEVIKGFAGNDTLIGGPGDDHLVGGLGDDTYIWQRGDGKDVIDEYHGSGGTDRLELRGIRAGEISFRQNGDEITLVIAATAPGRMDGGSVRWNAQKWGHSGIESVVLADNVTWTADQIRAMAVEASGTSLNESVWGFDSRDDALFGRGGDDRIESLSGNDTLTGGPGDDYLVGGLGDDTYIWQRGDGKDVIHETQNTGGTDRLELRGIRAGEISFRQNGNEITLVIAATAPGRMDGGSVRWDAQKWGHSGIESVVLADNVTWTADQVRAMAGEAVSTPSGNAVSGSNGNDTLSGGVGDDTLDALGGGDELIGGAGNDTLIGGSGDDTYIWRRGDGHDVIDDHDNLGGTSDRLLLQGIRASEVSLQRSGQAATLVIAPSGQGAADGGSVNLGSIDLRWTSGIESVVLQDATWLISDIRALLLTSGAAGNDTITGFAGDDTIRGGGGDDVLSGGRGNDRYLYRRGDGADIIRDGGDSAADRLEISGYARDEVTFTRRGADGGDLIIRFAAWGDEIIILGGLDMGADVLEQIAIVDANVTLTPVEIQVLVLAGLATPGDDVIVATAGNDTLSGGRGNDLLQGGGGDDVYLYSAGDGDDWITDTAGRADTLRLADYRLADIRSAVRAGPDSFDLVIELRTAGDRIRIEDALGDGWLGVERVEFADGVVWTLEAMRQRAVLDVDTAGNDTVVGFDGADVFEAKAGQDVMMGGTGADSYRFRAGSGHDTIRETDTTHSVTDTVAFLDVVSNQMTVERLFRGSDAVVFRVIGNATDSVTVATALANDGRGVESYVFKDGVSWNKERVRQLLDNAAPVAGPDGYFTVLAGQSVTILKSVLLRNDFDANNDPLSIIGVEGGPAGRAELNANGDVVFTASREFSGPSQIRYLLSDGRNGLATGAIDVRVRPVAEARDDRVDGTEDQLLIIRTLRLLSNDGDPERMIISSVFDAQGGTVSLASNGEISFTPTANFNGEARFTYAAFTPEGARAEAKVFINVVAVNDAPVAASDSHTALMELVTREDDAFVIDVGILTRNDRDVDDAVLTVSAVTSSENIEVRLLVNNRIEISPRDYFFGTGHFDYTVRDVAGLTSTARVFINVTPVNNAPELQPDRISSLSGRDIREDNPAVIGWNLLLDNDVERDGPAEMAAWIITGVGGAVGGSVRLQENRTILFQPRSDFFGEASFTYTVSDGQGGSSTARATIVYQSVNDNPTPRDDHYNRSGMHILRGTEDLAIEIPILDLLNNDDDVEDNALGRQVVFQNAREAQHGTLEVTSRQTIIYRPNPDFWGETSFSYSVVDSAGAVGAAGVTLFFENVGDAPPVPARDEVTISEDVPMVIPFSVLRANDIDIDRDELFLEGVRANFGINGTVSITVGGDILFTPNLNATQSGGFFYRVTDRAQGSAEGFVNIRIIPVNDQPVAVDDDVGQVPIGLPVVLRVADLLRNDYDVDVTNPQQPALSFERVDPITGVGFESISHAGETFIALTPAAGFTGNLSLRYFIREIGGEGLGDDGLVTARVSGSYSGTLTGSARPDVLIGNDANETITGLDGDDLIRAMGGADVVDAGGGHDTVDSGAGNDRIDGGAGEDTIVAGAGDDVIDGGQGRDLINGGAGFDMVSFAGSNSGVRAGAGTRAGQGGFAEGDIYVAVEGFIGSRFDDQLSGDGTANRLEGGEGNDALTGLGGVDTLLGGAGNDTLTGGAGADVITGDAGLDTADYTGSAAGVRVSLAARTAAGGDAQGDVLSGIENVTGSDHADRLEGDDGANMLIGGAGADTLLGGGGDDTLRGGSGADVITGGAGTDLADYSTSDAGVTVDMANGAAGGGAAQGDQLSGIEIVQGSFHNDVIRGDGGENILRGGRGADELDGRGGRDTADYAMADEAVTVDLSVGRGLAGEALNDRLISIEVLRGSVHGDTLHGDAGQTTFDGGLGNDRLSGRAGSDIYLFGFGSGEDTIIEAGDAAGTDRVTMASDVLPKDVSVTRVGEDLVIELERGSTILVDRLTVKDHFLSREAGIEEIAFANGVVWDRTRIEAILRAGPLNAEDDHYLHGREDTPERIETSWLLQNDSASLQGLSVISVGNGRDGTATLNADGTVTFLGARDHFGAGYFTYTVRDQFGRESTAEAKVNLSPINDAPVAQNDGGNGRFRTNEDQVLMIPMADLLANDSDIDSPQAQLSISGFAAVSRGVASVNGGFVHFRPTVDFFGLASFTYILSDGAGGTSTARVELDVDPVNDAPRGVGLLPPVRLGSSAVHAVNDLMRSVTDIEGDQVSFVSLGSTTNGTATFNPASRSISFTPRGLGEGTFSINVVDARGASAEIWFWTRGIPANDPPVARDDGGYRTLEDRVILIDPAKLLENDTDPNSGDRLTISALERFPLNGSVAYTADGNMIAFTPRPNYNGPSGFHYTISDGQGGVDTGFVSILIEPENDRAILRNDVASGTEDDPRLSIIAADAFGNDREPDGDVLFFHSATVLGVLSQTYVSGPMTANATLRDGTPLPSWLSFNSANMTFSGAMPQGLLSPVAVVVRATYDDAGLSFAREMTFGPANRAALQSGVRAEVSLPADVLLRTPLSVEHEFDANDMASGISVRAALEVGGALPQGLVFDAANLTLKGTLPATMTQPFKVAVTFSHTDGATGRVTTHTDTMTVDPAARAALAAGIAFDSDIALFAMRSDAAISAQLKGGRPLPEWLSFNAETMQITRTGLTPPAGAEPAIVQVVFPPQTFAMFADSYAATDRGFALEFAINPSGEIDPAINALLARNAFFAAQRLFSIDLSDAISVTALSENPGPLPSWLRFDAEELAFTGTPPSGYVGAIPVRLDVRGSAGGLPTFSIITDVVVDSIFTLRTPWSNSGFAARVEGERIDLVTPEDFNGGLVISYLTTDRKGDSGIAANPGIIVVNVRPQPELPDAGQDALQTEEDRAVRVSLATLLANDRDDDGDAIRAVAIGQPRHGNVSLELPMIEFAPPATLPVLAGGTYRATLADGTALPSWMSINATTGRISAQAPLAFAGTLGVIVTVANTTTSASARMNHVVDGNAGVTLFYTPGQNFSGRDSFTYSISDGRQGESRGVVNIDVASRNDPPIAVADTVQALEDTPLDIGQRVLTANDTDVDPGEAASLQIIRVEGAQNGAVSLANGIVRFVPTSNFDGQAFFNYVVTDGKDGQSTGRVTVNVQSTNRAPVAVADSFQSQEDVPIIITVADLLRNDSDPDGSSELRFASINETGAGIRALLQPNGRIQLVPDENVTGNVTVSYRVTDGRLSHTGTVTLTLSAVNDAPIAIADSGADLVTSEDTPLTIERSRLTQNDRDVEGNAFSLTSVSDANNGSVALVDGRVVFTPNEGYFGNASFKYTVTDTFGAQSIGMVSLAVRSINDLPIAVSDAFRINEDRVLEFSAADLLRNDFDADVANRETDAIRLLDVTGAELLASGLYSLRPAADFFGNLELSYRITDRSGTPITGRISVTVNPVADPPVALPDRLAMTEDTPLTIRLRDTILANDSDPDRGAIDLSRILSLNGVSVVRDGEWLVITPALNRHGAAGFEYVIRDGSDATARAQVTIDIASVNDVPVLTAPIANYTVPNNRVVSYMVAANQFQDADGSALTYTATLAGGGALPSWLTLSPSSGAFSGTLPGDFPGSIANTITASDGTSSASGTFNLIGPAASIINGTAGNDRLLGGSGHDTLNGLAGND